MQTESELMTDVIDWGSSSTCWKSLCTYLLSHTQAQTQGHRNGERGLLARPEWGLLASPGALREGAGLSSTH